MQIKIEVTDGKILVTGPYSPSNNQLWRDLGGKFSNGSWVLPDNDTTREVIANQFGAKSEEVDAFVDYSLSLVSDGPIAQIGGYVLAQRQSRDSHVQMPSGVSLAAGSFPSSGGSVKNPHLAASDDLVFRLRCRRSFAEKCNLKIAPLPEEYKPAIEV